MGRDGSPAERRRNGRNRLATRCDRSLVAACLSGDAEAWQTLVDRYRKLIHAVAARDWGAGDGAADIVQAVCLQCFVDLPRLRHDVALRAWLLALTRHTSYRWTRRQRRLAIQEQALDVEPTALGALPFDRVRVRQRRQVLGDAIGALPPRDRRVIELLFLAQPPIPYRLVATTLDVPIGSLAFLRRRALARLRHTLAARGVHRHDL